MQKDVFVAVCQKTVVDFTKMSDQQVFSFFQNRKTLDTCGRFTDAQLQQSYQGLPSPKSHWYIWVAAFVAAGMIGSLKLEAQVTTAPKKIEIDKINFGKGPLKVTCLNPDTVAAGKQSQRIYMGGIRTMRPEAQPPIEVTATIKDEFNKPIPFCSIQLKDTRKGGAADEDGKFHISVSALDESQVFVISAIGYETKEARLELGQIDSLNIVEGAINLHLKTIRLKRVDDFTIGETMGIIVTRVKKVSTKDKIAAMARKAVGVPAFKVSPNPVQAGSRVQINFSATGDYYLELLDINSRMITRVIGSKEEPNEPVFFNIPMTVVAGTYFVRFTNGKAGKSSVEKLAVY